MRRMLGLRPAVVLAAMVTLAATGASAGCGGGHSSSAPATSAGSGGAGGGAGGAGGASDGGAAAGSGPGAAGGPTQVPGTAIPSGTAAWRWLATGASVRRWLAADTSGAVRRALDTPTAYIVVSKTDPLPEGWKSTAVQSFTSYADLAAAVSGHHLLPGVKAVMYDDENWSFTPKAEQLDPAKYIAMAAAAAHEQGLQLIAAPAFDLSTTIGRLSGEPVGPAFLRLHLAAAAAPADVVDIQAQGVENDTVKFRAMVSAAADQIHLSSPKTVVLAGLSTSPSGDRQTATQIEAAAHAVSGVAAGFWLNDPSQGSYCPKCNGPFPAVAVAVLAGA